MYIAYTVIKSVQTIQLIRSPFRTFSMNSKWMAYVSLKDKITQYFFIYLYVFTYVFFIYLVFINAYSYEHVTVYSIILNNIEILHRSRKYKLITTNQLLSRPECYDIAFSSTLWKCRLYSTTNKRFFFII